MAPEKLSPTEPLKIHYTILSCVYTIMNWLTVRSGFGDILTFVDTRWYTLKFVSSHLKGLHYNELAHCLLSVWRYFDIR